MSREHLDREHCGAWPDACRHNRPNDRFLGTATLLVHGPVDVWVHEESRFSTLPVMHVCIRYGREDSDYISPGSVRTYLTSHGDDPAFAEVTALIEGWLEREGIRFPPPSLE